MSAVLDTPGIRVVRLRPSFIFQERAASEQRRIFAGPFLPASLLRPGLTAQYLATQTLGIAMLAVGRAL